MKDRLEREGGENDSGVGEARTTRETERMIGLSEREGNSRELASRGEQIETRLASCSHVGQWMIDASREWMRVAVGS